LRFLAQSNCNAIEKFGGVIVIIIEQIWCNWSNSDAHVWRNNRLYH